VWEKSRGDDCSRWGQKGLGNTKKSGGLTDTPPDLSLLGEGIESCLENKKMASCCNVLFSFVSSFIMACKSNNVASFHH